MLISLPHGVSLEADLEVPTGSQSTQENKLAILLHPWSWLGGRMNDPCVEAGASVDPQIDDKLSAALYEWS